MSFPGQMGRGVLATIVATVVMSFAPDANAQLLDETYDYQRPDRPRYQSPQHYALELRAGPYYPNIDKEFPNTKPYETAFGSKKSIYLGAEFDWQVLRIPFVGTFGPGFGIGWASRSDYANYSAVGASQRTDSHLRTGQSSENTSFAVMPMYLVGVLRVDEFAQQYGIPIVPYAKLGLGYGLWSTGNDAGISVRDGVLGRGHSWGGHFALGGSFLLDVFDRTSARQLDISTGINHTYAFAEWLKSDLGDLTLFDSKPQMAIGTSSWVIGMAFEM